MSLYTLLGNPVSHSKSPFIHRCFAQQTGIEHHYAARCVPIDGFNDTTREFFNQGGAGANVTLPFKQQAWQFADICTERARLSGAVNTLKRLSDGQILGDNTDGAGLLADLHRLNFISPDSHILLAGAGGAAMGAILPLLDFGCRITVTNRTFSRAQALAEQFHTCGQIDAVSQQSVPRSYHLVINATSSGIEGQVPELPILPANLTCYYDMFYLAGGTPFLNKARDDGYTRLADGIGMLVGQAAESFRLWHGVQPDVNTVIKKLDEMMEE